MDSLSIHQLVEAQRAFFSTGATRDVAFRIQQLTTLKNTIISHESDLCQALQTDLGKTPYESYLTEIGMVLSEISYTIKHLKSWVKPRRVHTPVTCQLASSHIYSDPYGCVLIISPWNYPVNLSLTTLVSALAGGNCVILKPSSNSSNTSALLARIIGEIFSPEYVTVIFGNNELHQQLLTEQYDFIFFTGSPSVGKKIMDAAAKHLTPVCLELGGKSPCIVDNTTDIKTTAKKIIWGKLLNAGQTCVAPDYVLVDSTIKDQLIQHMLLAISQFYGDHPAEKESGLPSIINERHFYRLLNLANGTNPANGKAHSVEEKIYNKEMRKITPTILDSPTYDAPVMAEEIFGPILPVIPVDTIDEAIAYVLSKPHPLALYLFSENKEVQKKIVNSLPYGGGCINDTILHLTSHHLPFGGVGQSGMGSYHGKAGFETFTHKKSVLTKKNFLDNSLRYPPFNKKISSLLRFFLK